MTKQISIDYPSMVYLDCDKNFEDMTIKEANAHLKWFVSNGAKRLELLKKAIAESHGPNIIFEKYNSDNLDLLWNWVIDFIDLSNIPSEEQFKLHLIKIRAKSGEFTKRDFGELSSQSKILSIDISFYFAELLLVEVSEAKWGLGKKSNKNIPSIVSKKYDFVIHKSIANLFHQFLSDRLYKNGMQGLKSKTPLRRLYESRKKSLTTGV